MVTECSTCACKAEVPESELFARLDETLNDYRDKPGNLIPILQIAQGLFGYLPENVLKHISKDLDKPYSEVAGVVSFYSFFTQTPRGAHTISVCMGTACFVKGVADLKDKLKEILEIDTNLTTNDGQFTLQEVRCIGACGLAPVVMVDDTILGNLKVEDMEKIVSKYRLSQGGTP